MKNISILEQLKSQSSVDLKRNNKRIDWNKFWAYVLYLVYKMRFLASIWFNLWTNFNSEHEANYVTSLMSRFDGMHQNMDLMYRIIGVC